MIDPEISIITPHYNRSELLKKTLHSVLAQNFDNWELLIIDDGSHSNEFLSVEEFIKIDSRFSLYKRQSAIKGPSACRNEGIGRANGKYIIFLDSDDLLDTSCLSNRHSIMEQNMHLDFAVFNIQKFDKLPGDIDQMFSLHPEIDDDYVSMFLRLEIPWQVMAPIWKKDTLIYLNGFNEEMVYAEDPELHLRALLDSSIVNKVFETIAPDSFYRISNDQIRNTKEYISKSIRGRIQFIKAAYKNIIKKTFDNPNDKLKYLVALQKGYVNIVAHFFNNIKTDPLPEFEEFRKFCYEYQIISRSQYICSGILVRMWLNDSSLNKILHYKGLFTKIYLRMS